MSDFVYVKNATEIAKIKAACAIFKTVREACLATNFENQTLAAIDKWLNDKIVSLGATSAFHGYQGFPGYHCLSKNEVIIHGIGTPQVKFESHDKLTLDIGINLDGYICDAAFTLLGSQVDPAYHTLSQVTREAIYAGTKAIVPHSRVGDVSAAIERYVRDHGYELLHDYGGHGCGIKIHEAPLILNYGTAGTGHLLKPGMIICLEPMVLQTNRHAHLGADGWSVIADQIQLVCHWEHMVLVTPTGCEILTE